MIRFVRIVALCLPLLFLPAETSLSHSGGTNANGCHTNRKTGDYHCHNARHPAPGSQTYCHVLNDERRCGYAKSSCEDLVEQFGGKCILE